MPGRARIREVLPQLDLGRWPPGRHNSITDVPGVLVNTQSIQPDEQVNTGVTTILPRRDWDKYASFAGIFRFNGCGEMTGSHWIEDSGQLTSPIIVTGTCSVGDATRGVWNWAFQHHTDKNGMMGLPLLPVVAETYDFWLSNQSRFPVTPDHVVSGIHNASANPVPEGNTGGGTGMMCHRFKGGTGSSSRVIQGFDMDGKPREYVVGVLVQANYGSRETLHIGGVPVGRILSEEAASSDTARCEPAGGATMEDHRKDGSIIVIIATDVPLIPVQLQRLARRATVGLGKVGGYGNNTSGDIFLAFSNANKIELPNFASDQPAAVHPYKPQPRVTHMIDDESINGVYEGAADATEEAVYNALCMAETMTGFLGHTVEALDLDRVREIVGKRL